MVRVRVRVRVRVGSYGWPDFNPNTTVNPNNTRELHAKPW
jgi:hypothetical protein